MDEATLERIRNILSTHLGFPENEILMETPLEDLDMDDLDRVEITFALEDEFDCEISDDLSKKWVTVSDIVDLMNSIQPAG